MACMALIPQENDEQPISFRGAPFWDNMLLLMMMLLLLLLLSSDFCYNIFSNCPEKVFQSPKKKLFEPPKP